MRDLWRAWRSFRARPAAEQSRLLRLLAAHARTHGVASALARARHGGAVAARDGYEAWCDAHTPTSADLARMRDEASRFAYQPLVTIITPVYNTDPVWLDACADSVVAQAYPRWQWSIGNDGSTRSGTLEALARIAARDPRIVVSHAPVNGGISAASNLALSRAEGEWVALMDSDDALLPHALFRMVEHLNRPGERPDVVYSDEDKLDLDGRRCEAYFKPDWSPDLFLSNMYVCHLLMARRDLLHEVGGFRTAFDFSQDYDLMLRLMERARRIDHVADIIYHWRKVPQSGATVGDAKPAAHLAGQRALQDHLARRGVAGEIVDAGPPGFYRVRYRVAGDPLVSIVTGAGAGGEVGERLRAATSYPRVEIVAEAAAARGDVLVFVGGRVRPAEPAWLEPLLEVASQPGAGVAAPRIVDESGAIAEMGLVLGADGLASRPLAGWPAGHGGYFGNAIAIRNVSAVGPACLVTPRTVWETTGGFDGSLASPEARAIDYSLKVRRAGHRVIVTPWSTLVTDAPAAPVVPVPAPDAARLRERWGAAVEADPYHNPHLPRHDLYPRG